MEEQAAHIKSLEGLNLELEDFLSGRYAREEALCARVKALEEELSVALVSSAAAISRLSQKETSLSSELEELRASLTRESLKTVSLSSERDGLLRRLEADALSHEREKVKSAENEQRLKGELAGFKNKDGEIDSLLREAGELKAGLALEREKAKDREARLQEVLRLNKGLERGLEQAAQENSRSEEGFLLKIELLKKELGEHSRRAEELRSGPSRAMLREAEDKLLVKEKMLPEMDSRLKKARRDIAEIKDSGQYAAGPGYSPEFEALAAGVAHQVAKTVSIIRSHAEFCAEAPGPEGVKESLGVIVRNTGKLQKKMDAIMNFSRPVIPQRSPVLLSAALSEVLDGLRSSGRLENLKVRLKGGEDLGTVSLDRTLFASAAEQLLLNAAEAMPGGGELSVSLSGGGGRQRLEVADTGAGVDLKNQGAVFRPFFTTRPGRLGLGLTFARNVAMAHGGTLELLSGPGKGARAVLEFPEI